MKAAMLSLAVRGVILGGLVCAAAPLAAEEEPAKDQQVALADGQIQLTAPKSWQKKQPRTRIVEYEFAAPAADGDEADGRMTIMGAGGSVEQNVQRWVGQFTQPSGKNTADVMKSQDLEVSGVKVRVVDLKGTFKDQPGPLAPAVNRENYRMLGAIIVTPELGQYFLKLTGPEKTIAAHEEAFHEMVKSLKVAKAKE